LVLPVDQVLLFVININRPSIRLLTNGLNLLMRDSERTLKKLDGTLSAIRLNFEPTGAD
jgi:hypothetical protein